MSYPKALSDYADDITTWSHRNFPNALPWHPLLGLVEELGELSHAYLKREQGIRGTHDEHTEAMIDAVGDLLVYLLDFCGRNGLDVESCLRSTWQQVRERDWIAYPGDGRTR